MIYPSRTVRLTVPISAELSERLSVLAYHHDLTRQQYVRRLLEESLKNAIAGWAKLTDVDPNVWYADARGGYLRRRGIPKPKDDRPLHNAGKCLKEGEA